MPTESCENCNRLIGTLETPRVWHDRVVCASCLKLLEADVAQPLAATRPGAHWWETPLSVFLLGLFVIGGGWAFRNNGSEPTPNSIAFGNVLTVVGIVVFVGGFLIGIIRAAMKGR